MDKIEAAYVAGLLDGEGCFTFNGDNPMVILEMSHEPVVAYLASLFGYRYRTIQPSNPAWNTQYRVQVYGHKAQILCRAIRPYLRVKAACADVILAWPYPAVLRRQRRRGDVLVDTATREQRAALRARMKVLNRRGHPTRL